MSANPTPLASDHESQVEVVPPAEVLFLCQDWDQALQAARDIEELLKNATYGAFRQFGKRPDLPASRELGLDEFTKFAKRVQAGQAVPKFRKIFLCQHRPNLQQEFWFDDKQYVQETRGDVLKQYVVVHVHYDQDKLGPLSLSSINEDDDFLRVNAVNARHLAPNSQRHAPYQAVNPFLDTIIEPSGKNTLKVLPEDGSKTRMQWRWRGERSSGTLKSYVSALLLQGMKKGKRWSPEEDEQVPRAVAGACEWSGAQPAFTTLREFCERLKEATLEAGQHHPRAHDDHRQRGRLPEYMRRLLASRP